MSRIVVDELVTLIGADVDKAASVNVEKFKGQLLVLGDAAMNIAGKVWQFGQRLNASVMQSGTAAMGIGQLATRTGLTTKAIQELGYAVTKTGGDAAALRGDLDKLNALRPRDTSMEKFLIGLSHQMSAMSEQEAALFGTQRYGLSIDTVRLLQQGADGMKALREEAVKMKAAWPESVTRDAALWNQRLMAAQYSLRTIEDRITIGVLPAVTRLTMRWRDFLADHGEAWGRGFKEVLDGATQGFNNLLTTAEKLWNLLPGAGKGNFPGAVGKFAGEGLLPAGVAVGIAALLEKWLPAGLMAKLGPLQQFLIIAAGSQTAFELAAKGPMKADVPINDLILKENVSDKALKIALDPKTSWLRRDLAYAQFDLHNLALSVLKDVGLSFTDLPKPDYGLGPSTLNTLKPWENDPHKFYKTGESWWESATTPAPPGISIGTWMDKFLHPSHPWLHHPNGAQGGGGDRTVHIGEVNISVNGAGSPKATADQIVQQMKRLVFLDSYSPGTQAPMTQ